MVAIEALVRNRYFRLMDTAPSLALLALIPLAFVHSLRLRAGNGRIEISRGNRTIRLSREHQIYLPTLFREFDHYHAAVEPENVHGREIVDFSIAKLHQMRGYPDQPMQFPALPEPVQTAEQYLDLAKLEPGEVVLDLGAYAGLTSILFDKAVGPGGRVIAVEADPTTIGCMVLNLAAYRKRTGRIVDILHAAVWNNDGEISFSAEANMGSSAVEIVGASRSKVVKVTGATLASIADKFGLDRIDFIKCDIEGAEAEIFDQPRFFARFRPRILIEVHQVDGKFTSHRCQAALASFGYRFQEVEQIGSNLPLLLCFPVGGWSG